MTTQPRKFAFVGNSLAMANLRALVAQVAPTRLPILIEGETGSGKELVAALVHQSSGRSGELVSFNVCAIGESMFEDALFGHVRGAYTGAQNDSPGFLREAHGGTAFFDEISGLPLPQQAKLLRAIETGVFRPIDATRDAVSDFRVVAATNERLADLCARGAFRADLRHRLSGVVVAVPPLADRTEDIPDLVYYFLDDPTNAKNPGIDADALELLMTSPWPGNVRELKLVVDTARAFARGQIDVRAVRAALAQRSTGSQTLNQEARRRQQLLDLLQASQWNVTRAAAELGMHPATLYRRMKRYGIDAPRFGLR